MSNFRGTIAIFFIVPMVGACTGDKGGGPGSGEERDARLISDIYTWLCDDGTPYQGVLQQEITLEYAPDALASLAPPSAGGCQVDKDMFPSGPGDAGSDLPDFSGSPSWSTEVDSGELSQVGAGFWRDDVSGNVLGCQDVSEVMGSGVSLVDASILTGVTTPAPPEVPVVSFDGLTYNEDTGVETIEWGDEVTATWDEHGWEQVWVQFRREREGEAWESVTCNATGEGEFTMTSDIWDLMDSDLETERNNIYVAFTMTSESTTESGMKVEAVSRAMAVGVVQD